MFWELRWPDYSWEVYGAKASVVIFLAAGVLAFGNKRRATNWLALMGGACAVPWFVLSERDIAPWNSWLALNCPPCSIDQLAGCAPFWIRLKLLAIAFVGTAVVFAASRLMFQNTRKWQEAAVVFVAFSAWFGFSVTPYQLPIEHAGLGGAYFAILHVEKRGLSFRETGVFVQRDGKFAVSTIDRRWFQYKFPDRSTTGVISTETQSRVSTFIRAADSWVMHTPGPQALRSWNAEGWYMVTLKRRFCFTTLDGVEVPPEVKDLLTEIAFQKGFASETEGRDICFGFCYDPPAALGYSSEQARSWLAKAR